jgi:hypothetical protein
MSTWKPTFQFFQTAALAAAIQEHNAIGLVATIAVAYERTPELARERMTLWTFTSHNGGWVQAVATDGGKHDGSDVVLFERTLATRHVPGPLQRIWVSSNEDGIVMMLPEDH